MGNTNSDLTFLLVIRISYESPCSKYLIPFIHAIYEINGQPIPNEEKLTNKNQLKELLIEDTLEFKVVNLQERRKQIFKISKKGESLGISVKPLNAIPNFLCLKPVINEQMSLFNKFDRIIGIEGTYADSLENFFRALFLNRNHEVNLIVLNIGMQSVRKVVWKLKDEFNFLNFEVSETTEEEKIELATGVKNLYNSFEVYNFKDEEFINNESNVKKEPALQTNKKEMILNENMSSITNTQESINKNHVEEISLQITPSIADQLNSVDSTASNNSLINQKKFTEIYENSINNVKLPLKPETLKNSEEFKYSIPKYPGQKPQKLDLTFQDLNVKDTPISKYERKQMIEKEANDICNEVYKEPLNTKNSSYLDPQPEIIQPSKKNNDSKLKAVPDFFKVPNDEKFTLDDLLKRKP